MTLLENNASASAPESRFLSRWEVWKYPLLAFLICFFIQIPILFLGLDFTDIGFHLTNQSLSRENGISQFEVSHIVFLSDYIAGVWNFLVSGLGYLGARLGFSLVHCFCAALTMKIIQNYIRDKRVLLAMVITATLIVIQPNINQTVIPILDYYTVPMLLGFVYIVYSASFIRRPTYSKSTLLSFLLITLFLSRYSMVLFLSIPLMSFFFIEKQERKKILYLLFVTCTLFIVAYFILSKATQSSVFGLYFHATSKVEYDFLNTLIWYKDQIKVSLEIVYIVGAVSFIVYKIKPMWAPYPIFLATCLLLFAVYLPAGTFFSANYTKVIHSIQTAGRIQALGVAACVSASIYIFWAYSKIWKSNQASSKTKKETLYLILSSIVFCFSIGFGSSAGLSRMIFGSWFLVAILAFIVEFFPSHKFTILGVSLLLSGSGIFALIKNPYRDNIWKGSKLSVIKNGRIKGIITSKERQEAIDELLVAVAPHLNAGSFVLAYPHIPMIYYATTTRPVTNFSWLCLLKENVLIKELNQSFSVKTPRIIVRAKFDACNWIIGQYNNEKTSKKVVLIDNLVQEHYNPKLIWTSDYFDVFAPSNSSGQNNKRQGR